MARGTTAISEANFDPNAKWGADAEKLRLGHNELCGELDALYAKLDTDSGVAGTDYASTIATANRVVPTNA